jgi:hypothetical protein
MAKQAKYKISIPKVDDLQNSLGDLMPKVALQVGKLPGLSRYKILPSHQAYYGNRLETFEEIEWIAEDHPTTDSHVKELALYIAQAANRPTVDVEKYGPQGIQHWEISNSSYVTGHPAPSAQPKSTWPNNPNALPHYQGAPAFS